MSPNNQQARSNISVELPCGLRGSPVPARCERCGARSIGVCGALADEELDALNKLTVGLSAESDQTIFYEGDPATNAFNITKGTVRLTRLLADGRRSVIGFMFAGDFLGLSHTDTYVYSAEAVTPVEACQFRKKALRNLFSTFPKLESRLLELVTTELIAAQDQMLLLSRKTPQEKLASFLVYIQKRLEALGGSSREKLTLFMPRIDIADHLGLTPETISRTLTRFTEAGVIEIEERRNITILKTDRLADIAEGNIVIPAASKG